MTISNQEALEILVNAKFCINAEHEKQVNEAIETLQEVVDKATPKYVKCPKGFNGYRYTNYICPNCNKRVRNDEKYCHKCGQHIKFPKTVYDKENNRIYLDWSEDE